ncbi:MAG TPA: lysyl oxidase family protein [Thermoanaerobaculia bacterium]
MLASTCLALGALCVGAPARAQGLPDLVVRTDILERQWVVRDEKLDASFCSVIEGEVTPGLRRLVRFTVMTANMGTADINIGDPLAHYSANDGLFELSTCHDHFHFRNYATYELIDPRTGKVWKAAKRGFCMLDTDPNPAYLGEVPKNPVYHSCGTLSVSGNQGISHGWTDTYRFFLGGQYFVLDGGDGQPVVPPGDYIIRITANPPYKATKDNPCRFLDPNGMCHALQESNYFNNVGQALITIPDRPGKDGYGPLAGSDVPKTEDPEH